MKLLSTSWSLFPFLISFTWDFVICMSIVYQILKPRTSMKFPLISSSARIVHLMVISSGFGWPHDLILWLDVYWQVTSFSWKIIKLIVLGSLAWSAKGLISPEVGPLPSIHTSIAVVFRISCELRLKTWMEIWESDLITVTERFLNL